MANEKRFGCLGILLTVVLCLSLLFNVLFVVGGVFGMTGNSLLLHEHPLTPPLSVGLKTKIAVIRLSGLISNFGGGSIGESMVEDIKIQLDYAVQDQDVKAIVLLRVRS